MLSDRVHDSFARRPSGESRSSENGVTRSEQRQVLIRASYTELVKYAIAFISFGALAAIGVATATSAFGLFLCASLAVAFLGVGAAYAGVGPRAFLKRADGRLRIAGYALFWPYFVLNHASLLAYRQFTRERAFDEIVPGVFLGARLFPGDERALRELEIVRVLDLTCEFSEVGFLRRAVGYLCIPLLDTMPPSQAELDRGIAWLETAPADSPVYVHCAMGHGRSATFVAALLVARGLACDARAAEAHVQSMRPRAGLNPAQRQALAEYTERQPGIAESPPDC